MKTNETEIHNHMEEYDLYYLGRSKYMQQIIKDSVQYTDKAIK